MTLRCLSTDRLVYVDECPKPEPSLRELLIPHVGKPVGGSERFKLTISENLQAHIHVLINFTKV